MSQKLTIESLGEQTLMMVAPFSEGKHLGLHLREFGICAVYSMNTSTAHEEKGNLALEKTQIAQQRTSQPRPYKSLNT